MLDFDLTDFFSIVLLVIFEEERGDLESLPLDFLAPLVLTDKCLN